MGYRPFAHLGLKAISVGLAVLLWLLVGQEAVVERGLRVPLELQNLPENLEMVEPPQESVDIRVRGSSDVLGRLVPGDVVATVDLSAAQTGRRLFQISPEQIRTRLELQVTQVMPATVPIRFEPSATRIVPVMAAIEGEPGAGFIVGEITADPRTVEVVGPESMLRRVTEAITEPVWVGSAATTVREEVAVGVPDPGVRLKTPRTAMVTVTIVQAGTERQLQGVPVLLRNVGPGLTARAVPAVVTVRVRGGKDVVGPLKSGSVIAFVDLAGMGQGEYGLPVRLEPVSDFGVDRLEPAVVNIRIQ